MSATPGILYKVPVFCVFSDTIVLSYVGLWPSPTQFFSLFLSCVALLRIRAVAGRIGADIRSDKDVVAVVDGSA